VCGVGGGWEEEKREKPVLGHLNVIFDINLSKFIPAHLYALLTCYNPRTTAPPRGGRLGVGAYHLFFAMSLIGSYFVFFFFFFFLLTGTTNLKFDVLCLR